MVSAEKTHHLFSEIALNSLLQLLKKQVAENSRHLNQYFQVFLNYANRGVAEVCPHGPVLHLHLFFSLPQRKQLLHLSVPSLFIAVALDEGPGPPLRSPYADLSKLYAVVGILVRSCDVSVMQKSLYEVRFLFTAECACQASLVCMWMPHLFQGQPLRHLQEAKCSLRSKIHAAAFFRGRTEANECLLFIHIFPGPGATSKPVC